MIFIYGIGFNDQVRYIGKTYKNLNERLKEHLQPSRLKDNTHKNNWIKSILRTGFKPKIFLIETCNEKNSAKREMFWIAYCNKTGRRLTNNTIGGDGAVGWIPSDDNIKNMKDAQNRPDVLNRNRERMLGNKFALGKTWVGKPKSQEGKDKLSILKTGTRLKEETREKISFKLKGRVLDEEWKKKIGAGNSGKIRTQDTKDAIRKTIIEKGISKGENNPNSKLTNKQTNEIIDMFKRGENIGNISKKYMVTYQNIRRILKKCELI